MAGSLMCSPPRPALCWQCSTTGCGKEVAGHVLAWPQEMLTGGLKGAPKPDPTDQSCARTSLRFPVMRGSVLSRELNSGEG